MAIPIFVVDKYLYGYFSACCAFISFPIGLFLLIQHIKQLKSRLSTNEIQWNYTFLFSLILFFWVIVAHICWFWVISGRVSNDIECYVAIVISTSCYIMMKWSLYMYLAFRLGDAFKNTFYAYSNKFLYCWRTFLIGSTVLEIFLTIFFTDVDLDYNKYFVITCRSNYHSIVPGTIAFVDIIACCVNLYFFIRQLKQVENASKNVSNINDEYCKQKKQSQSLSKYKNNNHNNNNETTNTNTNINTKNKNKNTNNSTKEGKHETRQQQTIAMVASKHTHTQKQKQKHKAITVNSTSVGVKVKFPIGNSSNSTKTKSRIKDLVFKTERSASKSPESSFDQTQTQTRSQSKNSGIQINMGPVKVPDASPLSPSVEIELNIDDDDFNNTRLPEPILLTNIYNNGETIRSESSTATTTATATPVTVTNTVTVNGININSNRVVGKNGKNGRMGRRSEDIVDCDKEKERSARLEELVHVIRKQTILTAIGVISTVMAMIFIGLVSMPMAWYVSITHITQFFFFFDFV